MILPQVPDFPAPARAVVGGDATSAAILFKRLAEMLGHPEVMRYMPGGKPLPREKAEATK